MAAARRRDAPSRPSSVEIATWVRWRLIGEQVRADGAWDGLSDDAEETGARVHGYDDMQFTSSACRGASPLGKRGRTLIPGWGEPCVRHEPARCQLAARC